MHDCASILCYVRVPVILPWCIHSVNNLSQLATWCTCNILGYKRLLSRVNSRSSYMAFVTKGLDSLDQACMVWRKNKVVTLR